MSRFDRIALLVVVVLLIVFAGLGVFSNRVGLPAPEVGSPAGKGMVGGKGPLLFVFGQDMDRASVESRVRISPETSGKWVWEDSRRANFYPDLAFKPGDTVTIRLQAGARGIEGREINREQVYSLTVRAAEIVYLGSPIESPELWLVGTEGDPPRQLTFTNGNVYDFGVSADGEWIVYSRFNSFGGSDLVMVDRTGGNERLLADCGEAVCREAVFSPNGQIVAYSQYMSGRESLIYSVNVATGESGPMFDHPDVRGNLPSFSPDGSKIAFYDLIQSAIRIVNLSDGASALIPSIPDTPGIWSSQGESMIVADLAPQELIPYTVLYLVNLQDRAVEQMFEGVFSGVDFSLPEWSPDGTWLLAGLRSAGSGSGKQIWVMRPDGSQARAVTDDILSAHAAYHWAPAGGQAVFQRVKLGSSASRPELVLWDQNRDELRVLVEDAALPAWLP